MHAINAYIKGWKIVFNNKKMWSLLYGFNFVVAVIASIPVSSYLNQTLGHSLAASKLLDGFNYTLITDLRNEYGTGIDYIMNQSQLVLILFLLSSIFLMGGILKIFASENGFDFATFWRNCFYFFWRIFRLTFYFLILQGMVLGLFGFLFLKMTKGLSPFELESDKQIIIAFQILAPIYLLIAGIVFMIQDYAKIHVVKQDQFLLTKPFWQSFSIVFKNFKHFFPLYLLNILSLLALFGLYWVLSNTISNMLLLAFLFGQLFIFSRMGLKLLNLASANILYQKFAVKA